MVKPETAAAVVIMVTVEAASEVVKTMTASDYSISLQERRRRSLISPACWS